MPIVILTGDRRAKVARACVRKGAQDFLVKGSFDGDALLRSIRFAILRRQDQLRRVRSTEQDRLRSIGMLAGGAARELNTPAAMVATWVQTLPPSAEVAQAQRAVENAQLNLDKMAEIVAKLHDFSRRDAGDPTPVDLNEAVRTAMFLIASKVRPGAVAVSHSTAPAVTTGHWPRLTQVFVHLLLNAADAVSARPAPRIEVSVDGTAPSGFVVTVRDNGKGMAPLVLRRAFEPFFSTKPVDEALGLGLALCQEVVAKHKGTIELESRLGEGTVATVRLPSSPVDA